MCIIDICFVLANDKLFATADKDGGQFLCLIKSVAHSN